MPKRKQAEVYQEDYMVDKIVAFRLRNGKPEYLVRWVITKDSPLPQSMTIQVRVLAAAAPGASPKSMTIASVRGR